MRTRARLALLPLAFALLTPRCSDPAEGGRDGGTRDSGSLDGSAAGDGGTTGDGAARCASGVDTDGDGLTNEEECALGSDPFVRDTDHDGIPDGTEAHYPRICVADNRAQQRRPPPSCTADAMCMTGEHCRGLDPASADSDGDGVADNAEDPGLDGTIDQPNGETDPRLWDTDGDGTSDGMGGLDICRPMGLATVVQAPVASSPIQAGYDPAWSNARTATGALGSALLLDDAAAQVAGLVVSQASVGADAAAESSRVEPVVMMALGAGTSAVLLGRSLTTHDMNPAVTSTYRVARATSASALREGLVMPLTGAAAPAGAAMVGASSEFLVDVTTTRRTMGAARGRTDVLVTVAPRAAYDNLAMPTAIRASDLNNTTGIAEVNASLDNACQVFTADRGAQVDFLWTVDVSLSMDRFQQQVGQTAQAFFDRLHAAGVDFRVAVVAGRATPYNLTTPGLTWVQGSDPMGSTRLAYRATALPYSMMAADTDFPYSNDGSLEQNTGEEPIAGAIQLYDLLSAGSSTGAPADRALRRGAQVVSFFVADETGNNDVTRFFARDTTTWGATYPEQLTRAVNYFRTHHMLAFGLVNFTGAPTCDMTAPQDMRRCVILGSGGAWIPIGTATDADVAAAMARIVDAVAGASSQYHLNRSPITSTIKVRVRGMDVPRSRSEGFDYDPASRSVVFFGTRYRPAMGDQVVLSYRVWAGSLG